MVLDLVLPYEPSRYTNNTYPTTPWPAVAGMGRCALEPDPA